MTTRAVYVIVLREFKRFFRQRGRFVTTLARPLIWLFIVGAGFTKIIDESEHGSYMQFILPGIIGMTILFSSVFSTISVVWDREFGFLREMLVAPISRLTIVVGKLISGTILSLFQGLALMIVAPFLGIEIGVLQIFWMAILISLVAFSLTAFGLFIAARLTSLEGFNVIMNFIVLPMFFLSGALYPIDTLPDPLRWLTHLNPLTYGVDSFKHVLLKGGETLGPEFSLLTDVLVVSTFALVMTFFSAKAFEKS
ncbi:MAG: ABC transporter permease [Deltaproteobacteria bacterium]|nr:ABC transporter permease [Deltaproteobacteria bacterium]